VNKLTEDMIRVTRDPSGASGRLIRDRVLVVYVGHHALKDKRGRQRRFSRDGAARTAARSFIAEYNQTHIPACVLSMNCLCAGHARGIPANEACDTTEVPAERWTRQGRVLSYDGVEAIRIERLTYADAKLSPAACDAIADYVHSMLNSIDIDALTRMWMRKP
jgi:hypothetical protein